MKITIDANSVTPPFEQLKEQIIAKIERGDLAVDTKLPAIRALATELNLAANTVARSYKELEAQGYVITQGRFGTRVNTRAVSVERALAQEARAFVLQAKELGVGAQEIQTAFEVALADAGLS